MTSSTWDRLMSPTESHDAVWELFHENSKASPQEPFLAEEVAAGYFSNLPESLAFASYPEVKLPGTSAPPPLPAGEIVRGSPLKLETVATLLRCGYGVYDDQSTGARRRRSVYSGSSVYPLEIFVHAARVQDLGPGIYHYSPVGHSLRLLREGDHSQKVAAGLADGRVVLSAPLIIFIAAMPERAVLRYGERGYRFTLLEAGAVIQSLNLAAAALNLACVNTGEYFDREIDDVLSFDGLSLSTLYLVTIGRPVGEA